MSLKTWLLSLLAAGTLAGAASNARATVQYSVAPAGTLGGANGNTVNDINDLLAPQFVGQGYTSASRFHAYVSDGTTTTDLGLLSGAPSSGSSEAEAINNNGIVVGVSTASGGNSHAFVYLAGTMTDINPSTSGTPWVRSCAFAINDKGIIVGSGSATGYGADDGFIYDLNTGSYTIVSDQSAGFFTHINSTGEIVGLGGSTNTVRLYPSGSTFTLPAVGSNTLDGSTLNEQGQIASYESGSGTGSGHPVLWTPYAPTKQTGTVQDLGAAMAYAWATPYDINDWGTVVGNAMPSWGLADAFKFQGCDLVNLNDLIPTSFPYHLLSARRINDAGVIVCECSAPYSSDSRTVILTPL